MILPAEGLDLLSNFWHLLSIPPEETWFVPCFFAAFRQVDIFSHDKNGVEPQAVISRSTSWIPTKVKMEAENTGRNILQTTIFFFGYPMLVVVGGITKLHVGFSRWPSFIFSPYVVVSLRDHIRWRIPSWRWPKVSMIFWDVNLFGVFNWMVVWTQTKNCRIIFFSRKFSGELLGLKMNPEEALR